LWKQEVNQRLAAHKNRKNGGAAGPEPSAETVPEAGSRAAQAAARVAARYAQAPSYSQMLAEEARAAVRAAEAASQAALEAQAAAESVLAGLEAASVSRPVWEAEIARSAAREPAVIAVPPVFFDPFFEQDKPAAAPQAAAVRTAAPLEPREPVEIRWEPDMPVRPAEPRAARSPSQAQAAGDALEDWRRPAGASGEPEIVEPALPIHANLIQFPRELIAPRKARPRMAEGPLASALGPAAQLSIFEVDPGTISIEPAPAESFPEPVAPDWTNIKLDAEPEPEQAPQAAAQPQPVSAFHLAPVGFRLMAFLVDGALIASAFLVAAALAAANMQHPPAVKTIEIASFAALLAIGVVYQVLFFTLAETTPGMKYARISLCTFEDQQPTRAQLRRRLGALILSLLPVGLGILWAIFDEDHMSWHDRISRTYQRRG
jgi:uncharacterized RDD family membrane protein YckC